MEILLHELQPSNVFGSCRVTEKRNPPRIALGETESRFFGMPGQDSWIYRGGIPTLDAWSCGLRRRIGPPPVEGRLEADQDALRDESHDHRVSRFGSLLGGTQESHTSAWSISSSGPKSRALRSALCEIRPPWRPCGRDIRHTLNQPGKLPFSSPPRRVTVSSTTPLSYGSHLATVTYGLLLVIESWQLHVSSVTQVLTVLSVATLDSMHVLSIPAEA